MIFQKNLENKRRIRSIPYGIITKCYKTKKKILEEEILLEREAIYLLPLIIATVRIEASERRGLMPDVLVVFTQQINAQ